MSFMGMRNSGMLMRRDEGHVSGWFFGLSMAATFTYVVKYWWDNLRFGGGRKPSNKKKSDKNNANDLQPESSSKRRHLDFNSTDDDKKSQSSARAGAVTELTVEIPKFSQFEEAAQKIRAAKIPVSTADKLSLYGLYKQVTHGNAPAVSWSISISDQSKHHAWSQFRDMPKHVATLMYIEMANELFKQGSSGEAAIDDSSEMLGGAGVSSMPAAPEEVNEEDMTIEERFFAASGRNDVETLCSLLDSSAVKVNQEDEGGQTALHMAADAGANEALDLLLSRGADEKAADHYGISVLQAAVIGGHVSVADRLLKAGADPDQADDDGDTPRNCAGDDGSTDMRYLFRIGGSTKDESILEGHEEEDDDAEQQQADSQSDCWQRTAMSWETEEGFSPSSSGKQVVIDKLPSDN